MNRITTFLLIFCLFISLVSFGQDRSRKQAFLNQTQAQARTLPAPVAAFAQSPAARQLNTISRPGMEHRYAWQNNAWQHMGHLTYTYDAAGNATESIITLTGQTEPYMRTLEVFTAQNLPLTSTDQLWQNGQWVNDFRVVFTYDAAGRILLKEEQVPAGTGWQTDYAQRYTYQLNAAGHVTGELIEKFEDNTWQNWRKADYVPDATGAFTEGTFWVWETTDWIPVNRLTDVVWYDFATDRREKYTTNSWNGTAWEETERYTLTYGQHESIEQIMEMRMPNGQWIAMSRLQFNLDEHGNELGFYYEINQGNGWAFMFEEKNLLTYDADGNLIERIEQSRQEGMAALVNEMKFVFQDFQQINGVANEVQLQLQTWPNPATSNVQISAAEPIKAVYLFDLTGRQVIAQQLSAAETTATLALQQLPAGLYLLRAETTRGMAEQKLVKQ